MQNIESKDKYFLDQDTGLLCRIDKNGDKRYVFSVGSIRQEDHERIKIEARKNRLRIRDMYEDIIEEFYNHASKLDKNIIFHASPKGSRKRQQWIRYEVLQMAKELAHTYHVSDTAVMITAIKHYFRFDT